MDLFNSEMLEALIYEGIGDQWDKYYPSVSPLLAKIGIFVPGEMLMECSFYSKM